MNKGRFAGLKCEVVLPVLLTLLVQASVSMNTVAVPVLMAVAASELNVPPSSVGIFMSVIYFGATVIAPVSGYFIERLGPIGVSQICLFLCGIGLGAVSIPVVSIIVIGTLVMGMGYGPVTPASSHLLVRTTPYSMMSFVFSVKQTGVPLGGALAGAIVPHLIISWGWKISAIAVGMSGLFLAVFLHPYRKRYDTETSGLTRFAWKDVFDSVKMVLVHNELRRIVISTFFFSTMQLCLVSFIVIYLIEEVGMTLVQAGIILAAAQAGGVIGRIIWGAIVDRGVNPRLMLGIMGFAMAAGALSTAAFSPQWPFFAVLIVCALFGAAAIGWNGVYLAEVARVAGPEFAGMATGGSLFFTFAGILIGLPAFSIFVERTGSYPLGFGIIAVATFICGIALLLDRNSEQN
jgi:MFS family permease